MQTCETWHYPAETGQPLPNQGERCEIEFAGGERKFGIYAGIDWLVGCPNWKDIETETCYAYFYEVQRWRVAKEH